MYLFDFYFLQVQFMYNPFHYPQPNKKGGKLL